MSLSGIFSTYETVQESKHISTAQALGSNDGDNRFSASFTAVTTTFSTPQ